MKTLRRLLPTCLVLVFFAQAAHGATPSESIPDSVPVKIRNSLDILAASLNGRNYETLEPYLAEDFSYGDVGHGAMQSFDVLENLIKDYSDKMRIKSIDINVIKPGEGGYRVLTTYRYHKKYENIDSEIIMTADGKFLTLTIPNVKVTVKSEDPDD